MELATAVPRQGESEVPQFPGSTEIGLNVDLAARIALSNNINPTFILGPPRSGTTLLAQILGRGQGVLSLSEPFFACRALRPRVSRMMFQILRAYFQWQGRVPDTTCPAGLFSYLRDCALHKGQNRLIIKEVYSGFDHPHPLSNLKTTNAIIASGAPVIAIVRDPFDTVASTLKVVKRYVSGLPRRVFWLACDSVPCFKNDEEIAHHAATNWTKFAAWVQKEQLLLVRYEELIRQSASELRRICDFVGLSYNERMINKNYRPSAFGGLGDLKVILGARKSIHGRSVGRGRILKPTLRDIIQQICGRHARELGYSL